MPTLKIVPKTDVDLQKFSQTHIILIPIRSFSDGKSRLSTVLTRHQRSNLMRQCAQNVLTAARSTPAFVLTSDPEVSEFATQEGRGVISDQGLSLNDAIQQSVTKLAHLGIEHITIAHGDLPLATDITYLYKTNKVSIVPDRRGEGTNVISLPTKYGFTFSYGPGSFIRHLNEAKKLGYQTEISNNPTLMMDIDTPEDLRDLIALNGQTINNQGSATIYRKSE